MRTRYYFKVIDRTKDPHIRNMNILYANAFLFYRKIVSFLQIENITVSSS